MAALGAHSQLKFETFFTGYFHGATKCYLQNYMNEFCYRFNRRFWGEEILNRLVRLCVDYLTILLRCVEH